MAAKDTTTTLHVSTYWKEKVQKASKISGKSYSEFIRYATEKEADKIIADSV